MIHFKISLVEKITESDFNLHLSSFSPVTNTYKVAKVVRYKPWSTLVRGSIEARYLVFASF